MKNVIRLKENDIYAIVKNVIVETLYYNNNILYEDKEISRQEKNRATHDGNYIVGKNANGEVTILHKNKKRNSKGKQKSLSRLIIITFNNGHFERPRFVKNTQDYLVNQFNKIINNYKAKEYIHVKTNNDNVINQTCRILIGTKQPQIVCVYIESDDFKDVPREFDLENVKNILIEKNMDPNYYGIPDEREPYKGKKEKTNIRTNWDWIINGKSRPYRRENAQ